MKLNDIKESVEKKRLRKSKGPITGVLGGVGVYLGIEPIIIRIAFMILLFVDLPSSFFLGIFIYIVLAIFLPKANREHKRKFQEPNRFARTESKGVSCPKCGELNAPEKNFCAECGESFF